MTFASAAQKAFQRVGIINIFVCGRRQSRTSSYLSCCCSYLYEIWISQQVKNWEVCLDEKQQGSGFGTVGRAVDSVIRDP